MSDPPNWFYQRKVPEGSTILSSLANPFLLFTWLALLSTSPFASSEISERDIKAVYLYNFLQFVTWPKREQQVSSIGISENTVSICILGKDKHQDSFHDVEGQPLKSDSRTLVIHRLDAISDINPVRQCELLFITASEKPRYNAIISSLKNSAILLVGETQGFLDVGGMVEFHRVGDKMRWKINLTPTLKAGLKMDRRLLRSATEVIQTPSKINRIEIWNPLNAVRRYSVMQDNPWV